MDLILLDFMKTLVNCDGLAKTSLWEAERNTHSGLWSGRNLPQDYILNGMKKFSSQLDLSSALLPLTESF